MMLASIFIPHGHCYLWKPALVGLHIFSDGLTALAYYSIPFTLVFLVEKRRDIPYNWIFLLFGAFIVLCGTTHIMEIWTLWYPTYWISGVIKAMTAVVSIYTAVMLVKLMPQALAIPSAAQFEAVQNEILERQKIEAELQKAKETAEAANSAKSRFLASMSHELRTPLNSILGFSQIMHRDRTFPSQHKKYLDIINRSGQHLLKLINDVLEMSKIEAGQVKLNLSNLDLYRLLDSLEEMLALKATAKQLQLTFERAVSVPRYIIADESKLRQVLLNLLSNAIKFTQAGSVTLRVQVVDTPQLTVNTQQSTLLFEVIDTGIGIAPEDMNQLFEAFVQTSAGRQAQEGTGLGLPISRFFVRMMGGDISVNSVVGKGSVFAFQITVILVENIAEQTPLSIPVKSLAPNQPIYRLLIVEDTWEHRQLLLKLLEPLGFEIREAENGQQAVEMWETWEPHLIFMDMRMPVMNGYEATKKIKATIRGQATVIVALTASAFNDERSAILFAGCDDFIRKPFQEQEIFDKLTEHLGVRYVYNPAPIKQNLTKACESLTTTNLAVMPNEWVQQIYQAATSGNDERIIQLLDEIPKEHFALTKILRKLTDDFRFDKIIEIAKKSP
jgi:signal transduction histidine kinase/CheY-like chemotaxis protein